MIKGGKGRKVEREGDGQRLKEGFGGRSGEGRWRLSIWYLPQQYASDRSPHTGKYRLLPSRYLILGANLAGVHKSHAVWLELLSWRESFFNLCP